MNKIYKGHVYCYLNGMCSPSYHLVGVLNLKRYSNLTSRGTQTNVWVCDHFQSHMSETHKDTQANVFV